MFRYASPANMMTVSTPQFYARQDDRKALIEEYYFSHGLCSPCVAALYGDLLND